MVGAFPARAIRNVCERPSRESYEICRPRESVHRSTGALCGVRTAEQEPSTRLILRLLV